MLAGVEPGVPGDGALDRTQAADGVSDERERVEELELPVPTGDQELVRKAAGRMRKGEYRKFRIRGAAGARSLLLGVSRSTASREQLVASPDAARHFSHANLRFGQLVDRPARVKVLVHQLRQAVGVVRQ